MRISDIIKSNLSLAVNKIGEENIVINIGGTDFTITALVTQTGQTSEQDSSRRFQTDNRQFRFVLPDAATREPRQDDIITYDDRSWKIMSIDSGIYKNFLVTGEIVNKRDLGDRRVRGIE